MGKTQETRLSEGNCGRDPRSRAAQKIYDDQDKEFITAKKKMFTDTGCPKWFNPHEFYDKNWRDKEEYPNGKCKWDKCTGLLPSSTCNSGEEDTMYLGEEEGAKWGRRRKASFTANSQQ